MRTTIFTAICLFFLVVYMVSSSNGLMKKITEYRFFYNTILTTPRALYGDLYGISSLRDFKANIWKEKTAVKLDTCNVPRLINLYCICDSYLNGFFSSPSIFCGVKTYKFTMWPGVRKWDHGGPIETEVDSTQINVLLIERSERFFSVIPLQDYLDKIEFVKKQKNVKKKITGIISEDASFFSVDREQIIRIHNMIMNENIGQNLEFNLFDYVIFNPLKELKAQLNYKLFGRMNNGVSVIPGQPYLFLRETVDPAFNQSSFRPIDDRQIDTIVATLNSTCNYYRARGFDAVYFSIIPNPISIICPVYKTYNDLIRRVQNHPDLIMPMINIYDKLYSANCQVYRNADTHWNANGFSLWANEFNKYLRKVHKIKE